MKTERPVIFSGIQPSGILQIGNYIGALRYFPLLQDDNQCLYCIVDMHAITVRQDPAKLRHNSRSLAALYLACGIDPKKSIVYIQSHVSAHAELAWILNCFTYFGELSRMTQFKDKSAKHADNINAGLFTYPALMASDILLYQAKAVPVGDDQKQHIELTRDVAIRMNNIYGDDLFIVPEPLIHKTGSKVMSLQEPTRKMSKSDADETFVSMLDAPEIVKKKLKRAVTDSLGRVTYDAQNQPGVSNLLTIISSLTNKPMDALVASYEDKGYGALKADAAEAVIETLGPIQAEHARLMNDTAALDAILKGGAERANVLANRTLDEVKRRVGFTAR
ncbi:MAG: tryptophan--tRNA ligase [Oscillospiraceae bacterium]|jgi:tryptophanyl-tRNA synthetase|nr:tryptophan--tRNA ligase [Oscillospiraceae bacterium]